jgi:hypothetical protein
MQEEPTPAGSDNFVVIPAEGQVEQEQQPTPSPEEGFPAPVEQSSPSAGDEIEVELPEGWQLPLNLSLSGATDNPQMVRDRAGDLHVLWRDAIDGFVYATGSEDDWSDPIAPELPFFTRRYFFELEAEDETPLFEPVLAADKAGNIHSFWINSFEGDTTLYHSSVPGGDFTNYDSWSARQPLDDAARKVVWTMDDAGTIHIAYIRPVESSARPSGIYTRRLEQGAEWSDPVLLYASRYLRDVNADEANIQILADGDDLFAVWDDSGREQVYFARSTNGGQNWRAPQEIDRRSLEDDQVAAGPGGITVGSDGETLILSWRGGHEPGRACVQYASVSSDRGQTWSLREYQEGLPGCLIHPRIVATDAGIFLLGTTEQEGIGREVVQTDYLMAWDGERWSDPQVQEPLSSFINPDTFQPVLLSCLQAWAEDKQIRFLGCDEGNGRDVWLIAREMGDIEDWFPQPSVWTGPEEVGSSQVEATDLQLVVDMMDNAHAFWHEEEGADIYYAGWNGHCRKLALSGMA